MAGRKEYELLFQIKAALGPNYAGTFQSAAGVIGQLQGTVLKTQKTMAGVQSYQKQNDAINTNKSKLAELSRQHEQLQQRLKETDQPSESLRRELSKNEQQIANVTQKIKDQKTGLDSLGAELRRAGVDTDNLGGSNRELAETFKKAKREQEDFAKLAASQQKTRESISQVKTQMLGTVGAATALGVTLYQGPVKSAMELESSMAEVAKVVDWIGKSGTDQQIASYKELKDSVLDLTTQIPMTAQEITDIMAAAGQSNVASDNSGLVAFTEDAAKMGIAFDTTSAQAGEWMAKWRTSFKMSQEEVVTLSDKINYLSNTSAANALQISEIVTKVGPLGEVAGIASGEVAALGAALVATGVEEDVAATGIKRLLLTMSLGESTTKTQDRALKSLGISATDMAKRMQTDAQGAIVDLLGAIKKLPAEAQAATLKDYFGMESITAIAPLLTNLEYIEEQFTKVGDATQYAGSMEAEYAARADTTENKVQLAKNSFEKLSTVVGDTFLPYIGQGAEKLSELVRQFSDFIANNPEVVKNFTSLVGNLIALKLGGQAAKLGFLEVQKGVKGVQSIIKLFRTDVTGAGADTEKSVGGMTRVVGGLKSAFSLLSGPLGLVVGGLTLAAGGVVAYFAAQEKARQDTLEFSQDLKKAADSFDEVSDKAANTKALADEYRALDAKVQDVATSADEAAQAKDRMREIEDLLIEQNPKVMTKYDQENGKIMENLDLLERKSQRELDMAKIQLEQEQREAEEKLPDALKETAKLAVKANSLSEEREKTKKVWTGLDEIVDEWKRIDAQNLGTEEANAQFDVLIQKAEKLGDIVGETWSFEGNDIFGVLETLEDYKAKLPKVEGDILKTNEEYEKVTQSVQDYYDSSVKLAEVNLGGSFQTTADNLAKMKAELAELEQGGRGSDSRAVELKGQIDELEPKLVTAAGTIRDLGMSVENVPEMKTINVAEAFQNIDGLLEKLDAIPVSKKTTLIVDQVNLVKTITSVLPGLPGFASGGIITRPTVATFAEKSPEAAIPIDGSANAKALWYQTGQLLGMGTQAGSAGAASLPPQVSSYGERAASVVIQSAPVFHLGNNTDPAELAEVLRRYEDELLMKVERQLQERTIDERRRRYD